MVNFYFLPFLRSLSLSTNLGWPRKGSSLPFGIPKPSNRIQRSTILLDDSSDVESTVLRYNSHILEGKSQKKAGVLLSRASDGWNLLTISISAPEVKGNLFKINKK